MEHYIGVLATEGVTFVPIWTEPQDVPEKLKGATDEGVAVAEMEKEGSAEAEEAEDKMGKTTEGGSTVAQVSLPLTVQL